MNGGSKSGGSGKNIVSILILVVLCVLLVSPIDACSSPVLGPAGFIDDAVYALGMVKTIWSMVERRKQQKSINDVGSNNPGHWDV